jgi:hypothetical protein
MNRTIAALGALAATATLAACSYATPDTSSKGLSYTGGEWESKVFNKCVDPGGNEREDWGGYTAFYPVGVITWDFSMRPGAESGPLLVSTSNNQEMIQSGTVSLRLLADCSEWTDETGKVWPGGILQKWHEDIGQRNGAAFTEDSSVIPAGWIAALGKFVGAPAERAMDQTGGKYTWQDLYSNVAIQGKFAEEVKALLPDKIKAATGGTMYFEIISVELDKPTVPDALRNELVATEASILAQGRATQDSAFAESFPGGLPGYQAFLRQQAETKCLNDGRCTLVPAGAAVAVGG